MPAEETVRVMRVTGIHIASWHLTAALPAAVFLLGGFQKRFAMKLLFLFISAFQVFCLSAFGAELRGTVTNFANGEPLSGVIIRMAAQNLETSTDERGEYMLRDISVGRHVVNYSSEGFIPFTLEHEFADADRVYARHVELKPISGGEGTAEYMSEEPQYQLEEVTILATRAGKDHPVTYTNVSQRELQKLNYGQDTPLLLTELPNVSAYSEGGGGIGYSYLRMRGFSQDRIAVQINGVPLNDAETHEVFWVDLPDFAEDLADMQVQRGVGSSLYGPAAFGGSINLVTRTPGMGDRPLLRAEGTYGSWNTRRAMVQFQSGRIHNRYGVAARLTRMETDGYRYDSWARLWSYYLSGARFTSSHTTRVIFYGGPEKTHLAYEGVNRDYLEGRITGDQEHDRRFNEFAYPGEIDNFFQPHYELHDTWVLDKHVSLDNSLYLFKGDGYYDQYRTGEDPAEYFPHQSVFPDVMTDVLRRRNVNETDGGWIPRASIEHRFGMSVVGGELRLHDARHEGILLWSEPVTAASPDHHYYDYGIKKVSLSGYLHNLINLTDRLDALADLQLVSHQIKMQDDEIWGVAYDKTYSSVSPRLGLKYALRKRSPVSSAYGNLSFAQREPKPRDIYDPQDYWQLPSNSPGHLSATPDGYEYTGPSLVPEKLMNIELGTEWRWRRANLGVNAYYMQLKDAIVPYGALDNLGLFVTINANETVHQGLELVAGTEPVDGLKLSGNLALTDHHFADHTEYDFAVGDSVARDGNRIAFDPNYVANARAEYNFRDATAGLSLRAVGKQYVDNTQDEDTAVPAYTLVALDLGYRFGGVAGLSALDAKLRVNNLLDSEYEAFGYNYGEARYIVGAPRSLFVTLGVEL